MRRFYLEYRETEPQIAQTVSGQSPVNVTTNAPIQQTLSAKILCKTENDALVNLTLPENASIYVPQYQLYLPSKEELKKKLMEWSERAPDTPEAT